jgi:hypothetical protein
MTKMTAYQPYECKESIKTEDGVKYFFVSKGKKHIVKAIHYMYTGKIGHQRIFNLGFGDYLLEKDSIDDKVTTDNGDVYRVFNTVLNTIPLFFESFPQSAMIIQGSDSHHDFYKYCKETCKKKCDTICKNQHRRINAYSQYINKNYDELIRKYKFYGGIKFAKKVVIEDFVREKKYDAVLVTKNNL